MQKPPQIKLKLIEGKLEPKFIWAESNKYKLQYPDGTESEIVTLDMAKRKKLEASVIVPYFYGDDKPHIYLRSCPRPAIIEKFGPKEGNLWELPAGLIDKGETPIQAAKRELLEEAGFDYEEWRFIMMGKPFFPNPGMSAEKLWMFGIQVYPKDMGEPLLDGGPMERNADIITISLDRAMELCAKGDFVDAKTELGIRRLNQKLFT